MIDIFCEWFEGAWSNEKQAYSNPRSAALVDVIHRRGENYEFQCSYKYRHRNPKKPYREYNAQILNDDGRLIVKNSGHDLIFRLQTGAFVSKSSSVRENILYTWEAYLGPTHYYVMDRALDLSNKKLLRGLEGEEFFEFDRFVK